MQHNVQFYSATMKLNIPTPPLTTRGPKLQKINYKFVPKSYIRLHYTILWTDTKATVRLYCSEIQITIVECSGSCTVH